MGYTNNQVSKTNIQSSEIKNPTKNYPNIKKS